MNDLPPLPAWAYLALLLLGVVATALARALPQGSRWQRVADVVAHLLPLHVTGAANAMRGPETKP